MALWRVQLGKVSEKAGQSLADPGEYPNLFPDFQASLEAEARLRKEREQTIPAGDFQEIVVSVCGGGGGRTVLWSRIFLPEPVTIHRLRAVPHKLIFVGNKYVKLQKKI